ncbi:TonB-dependent receptor [Flavobacterium sp. MXW15]|uniref:TonB-dependent receptor n=1 Tax=Xanthomonas chitinilytica TaxID=2989819 RepID=A0ABT3JRP4_9XANT|nr:TonB-dependent receptor [Xanthomonas sp. H13-6]MCW4453788.1 TonB-dependent receptor [Flavobacterium sp. MXW15]MCW4471164.1 TonB-dependent receptor [Xanthomonas sp. H13-6]
MRRILFLSIAVALQTPFAAAVHAQESRVASAAIPAQPLDSALNALSRQTGLQFVYSAQTAGNPQTRAVPAGLPPEQALAQLLAGTSLHHRFLTPTTITIETEAAPAMPPESAAPAAVPSAATGVEAQQLDSVMVVGSYSRSLEQAVDIKRANIGFSDSIVATDVADFPEQNLAEALQRMPGVTIERSKGLGSKVNVRGLPSEYTHVSINGLATASGSGGRDVEFDIFASEIIQQVTVQKSPTAADEEGGIAGSVQISTARPFDYQGRKLVVAAEGAHNSISGETDPKFSFLASDTWGDWGALVSFSRAQRTNRTDSTSGINFRPMSRFLSASDGRGAQAQAVLERDAGVLINDRTDPAESNLIVFQDKVGDRVYVNDQDKWGATASLQYKPSSNFSLTFDAMVGRYDTTEDEYDAAAYSASSRSTLETIHEYDDTTLSEYGMVVLRDVSYTATQHEFLSKERINRTDFSQYSLALDWKGDSWSVDAMLGYSGAKKTSDFANLKHVAYAPSRTRWTGKSGETVPSADPDTIDMYDAADRYLFEAYETTLEKVTDDKYVARLDFDKSLDLAFLPALRHLRFGARYTDKSKEREYGESKITGPGAGDTSWVNTRTLADSPLQWIDDIVPGGAYGMKGLRWQQVSNGYARDFFRYPGFFTPFEEGQYYRVDEEVASLYAMADFGFDLGSVPVALNAGARYVDTSVLSSGYHPVQYPDGTTGYTDTPVSRKGSYKDVLPSMNMTAELSHDLLLRAAASETMIRPSLTDIAYKRTASWSSFRFTDGNPDLKPTYARQWEIGLEKYLGNGGLLAASYFHKKIDGVVINSLTGVVEDVAVYNANGTLNGYYDFDVYQPVNASGSYDVDGIELIAQLPLETLHSSLKGFGINANYTLLDSSLAGESDLGIRTPMPGLAEKTYNLTVYYDNDRFDARVSYNRKGEYVEAIGYDMYPIWRDAYGQLDLSIGYRLARNVKLSLKGINMTNAATSGYTMDPSFPTMYERSGRRVSLGVRADF